MMYPFENCDDNWGAGQILAGNAVVLETEMVSATGDPPKLW